MPDDPEPSLRDLLTRLRIVLSQPVDFAAVDVETTIAKVRLLTAAAAYFNVLSLSDFGGRAGAARGEGLVEQVVAAAFQSFGGVDPRPIRSTRLRCCCVALRKGILSATATSVRAFSSQPTT